MQISQHYAFSPFNGHFPRVAELANTRLSPFWILLHLRMMELVVTTGAKRRAKLQSNHHHQQTNTQLFTGQMPFLSPTQQCQSTEGELTSMLIQIITRGTTNVTSSKKQLKMMSAS